MTIRLNIGDSARSKTIFFPRGIVTVYPSTGTPPAGLSSVIQAVASLQFFGSPSQAPGTITTGVRHHSAFFSRQTTIFETIVLLEPLFALMTKLSSFGSKLQLLKPAIQSALGESGLIKESRAFRLPPIKSIAS